MHHVGDEGEVDLRRLGRVLDPLHGDGALAEIDPGLLLEGLQHVVDDPVVEVDPAEEGVAAGGQHLEDVAGDLQHRDVEGAAAQVVDQHVLVQPAVEAVGQRRRGGLVDDPLHLEAGEPPGLLHRRALVVVVVGGDRDDRLRARAAEELLGDALGVAEDEGADLLQRVGGPAEVHRRVALGALDDLVGEVVLELLHHPARVLAADESLGPVDGVLRVHHHLVLGHLADQQIALVAQRHHRGQHEVAPVGGDDLGNAVPDRGDQGVGRPEVDSDDARFVGHGAEPSSLRGTPPAPTKPRPVP